MTDPTPNALSPQDEHAGPKPLSPAAQAVLDAFLNCSLNSRQWHDGMGPRLKIAAALRALADQSENLYDPHEGKVSVVRADDLLAIATELQNAP